MTLRSIGSKTLLGIGVAGVIGVAALAGASAPADQHVATRRGPDLLAAVDARPANWVWEDVPACLYVAPDRTNPSLDGVDEIC